MGRTLRECGRELNVELSGSVRLLARCWHDLPEVFQPLCRHGSISLEGTAADESKGQGDRVFPVCELERWEAANAG